jgi:phytoene synthase
VTDQDLDLARIVDPRLRAVHTVGAALFRKYAGGHFVARLLFPQPKRPYIESFWAFVLYIDHVVDNPEDSVETRAWRLDQWERMFTSVVDGTPVPPEMSDDECTDLVLARAFAHVLRTWDLPLEQVHTHRIFEATGPRATELCRQTITGFHSLDRLWDIEEDTEEDIAADRLHLPLDHLAKFDLDRPELERQLKTGQFSRRLRELFGYELDQARQLDPRPDGHRVPACRRPRAEQRESRRRGGPAGAGAGRDAAGRPGRGRHEHARPAMSGDRAAGRRPAGIRRGRLRRGRGVRRVRLGRVSDVRSMRAGVGVVPGAAAGTPRILVVFGRSGGGGRGRIRPGYRDRTSETRPRPS